MEGSRHRGQRGIKDLPIHVKRHQVRKRWSGSWTSYGSLRAWVALVVAGEPPCVAGRTTCPTRLPGVDVEMRIVGWSSGRNLSASLMRWGTRR